MSELGERSIEIIHIETQRCERNETEYPRAYRRVIRFSEGKNIEQVKEISGMVMVK